MSRNASDEVSGDIDEMEKMFVEKYFAKQRFNTLTPEIVNEKRRRMTSVAEAKERLKKQPYSSSIKHLRKISSTISPSEKL